VLLYPDFSPLAARQTAGRGREEPARNGTNPKEIPMHAAVLLALVGIYVPTGLWYRNCLLIALAMFFGFRAMII
jgi:hypothetical protein